MARNLPRTHRGYRWQREELKDFREFKALGHVPPGARADNYAIDYCHPTLAGTRYAKLYRRTQGPWEQCVAAMILNAPETITLDPSSPFGFKVVKS